MIRDIALQPNVTKSSLEREAVVVRIQLGCVVVGWISFRVVFDQWAALVAHSSVNALVRRVVLWLIVGISYN